MARAIQPRIGSTDLPETDGHGLRDVQGQTGGNRETGDYRESGDNRDSRGSDGTREKRERRGQGHPGQGRERGLPRESGSAGNRATSQDCDPERGTSVVAYLWHRFGPGGQQRRSQERERRADRVDTVQQIAWSWRKACEGAGLSQSIYTPSGHAVAVPRVGRITLGPPTLITLQPRPGQTREGIAALGPSLAAMMGVSEIRVWDLAPGWVTVELVRTRSATTPTPVPRWRPYSDRHEAA